MNNIFSTKRKVKESKSDKIFDIINYSIMVVVLVIVAYPLLFLVSASVSNPDLVWAGKVWLLPKEPSLEGYARILKTNEVWIGYRNTLFYTGFGVCINLLMTVLAAYPLSRKDFYVRNYVMALFTFTMFFSGGLIPGYLVVKKLGMINTVWAMIIPNAVSVYNIIVTKTYFQSNIPIEIQEAAEIDGCTNIQFLLKVVVPLSGPILAVMALFYGVGHWNAFFNGLIYLSKSNLYPLQLFLRDILIQNQMNADILDPRLAEHQQKLAESMKYGLIIISSVPVLIMYPFAQRFFIKGIMVGSLKG